MTSLAFGLLPHTPYTVQLILAQRALRDAFPDTALTATRFQAHGHGNADDDNDGQVVRGYVFISIFVVWFTRNISFSLFARWEV